MGKAVNRGFDKVSGGKGPSKSADWVPMLQERPKDKPFFFWFASSDAHRSWKLNDKAPLYKPEDIEVPPYLYDGPVTRKDLAEYMHEVSRTDYYMGQLRAELKRQGIEKDTYIIYMTDNGRPFPRCKTRLYDSGIRTPFLIARPGTIAPSETHSLISSIDISATILELSKTACGIIDATRDITCPANRGFAPAICVRGSWADRHRRLVPRKTNASKVSAFQRRFFRDAGPRSPFVITFLPSTIGTFIRRTSAWFVSGTFSISGTISPTSPTFLTNRMTTTLRDSSFGRLMPQAKPTPSSISYSPTLVLLRNSSKSTKTRIN